MSNQKFNSISFDTDGFMRDLKVYLREVLYDMEENLIKHIQDEVLRTTHGDAPGKPQWREMVKDNIDVLEERLIDNVLEADVGLDINMFIDFVRAMIVLYGSGSVVGNEKIHTKPGQTVWNDDLDGYKTSSAKSVYDLPKEFNQKGIITAGFIKNAARNMQKDFRDILEDAINNLASSIFYDNVNVSGG